jgi:hypothetical protein
MLMAASCPSNSDAAVTNRSGGLSVFPALPVAPGRSLATLFIEVGPPINLRTETPLSAEKILKNQ